MVLEKNRLKGSVSNFKTEALAVRKLKGNENCENEHMQRNGHFCVHFFAQKTIQLSNFEGDLYQLRNWIFKHYFP